MKKILILIVPMILLIACNTSEKTEIETEVEAEPQMNETQQWLENKITQTREKAIQRVDSIIISALIADKVPLHLYLDKSIKVAHEATNVTIINCTVELLSTRTKKPFPVTYEYVYTEALDSIIDYVTNITRHPKRSVHDFAIRCLLDDGDNCPFDEDFYIWSLLNFYRTKPEEFEKSWDNIGA